MPTEKQCLWITERRGIYLDPWTPEGKETIYSLTPVQKGVDGKVYLEWARFSKYDKEKKARVQDEKDRPVKVPLGTKAEAIKALRALLSDLMGSGATSLPELDDDSIPF